MAFPWMLPVADIPECSPGGLSEANLLQSLSHDLGLGSRPDLG
jgi:hypothetical protein